MQSNNASAPRWSTFGDGGSGPRGQQDGRCLPRPRLVMHSLLLGSISQQGPASRGYDEAATMTRTNSSSTPSLPSTINIPVYLVPVSAFMALLFCLPVMISKCVRATRPVSTTVMPQDAQPDAQAGEQGGAEGAGRRAERHGSRCTLCVRICEGSGPVGAGWPVCCDENVSGGRQMGSRLFRIA